LEIVFIKTPLFPFMEDNPEWVSKLLELNKEEEENPPHSKTNETEES